MTVPELLRRDYGSYDPMMVRPATGGVMVDDSAVAGTCTVDSIIRSKLPIET